MPKKKINKMSTWMSLYKWAVGAVVVMTVVAVGAMVWQYYDLQSKMWMVDDYEEIADGGKSDINLIDSPKARDGGLPLCGSGEETRGACKTVKLSTPTSGQSCQAKNPAGAEPGVTEAGCRAMAFQLQSWAGAFRSDACKSGLLFDQKTITSDMLVDKIAKTKTAKPISIAGMHKCVPGLAGRLCPVGMKYKGKATEWERCYTVDLKGACKYMTEEPVNVVAEGKLYKFCAPTNQGEVEGSTSCYTGSASKPTVKLCCPMGKSVVGDKCQ